MMVDISHSSLISRRAKIYGFFSGGLMIGVYLLLLWLASGSWRHVADQWSSFGPLILALSLGFGLQITLWRGIKESCAGKMRAGGSAAAASGGFSGFSMVVCCAHHLADFLPIFAVGGGLSFFTNYQMPLLWLSLLATLFSLNFLWHKYQGMMSVTQPIS